MIKKCLCYCYCCCLSYIAEVQIFQSDECHDNFMLVKRNLWVRLRVRKMNLRIGSNTNRRILIFNLWRKANNPQESSTARFTYKRYLKKILTLTRTVNLLMCDSFKGKNNDKKSIMQNSVIICYIFSGINDVTPIFNLKKKVFHDLDF